ISNLNLRQNSVQPCSSLPNNFVPLALSSASISASAAFSSESEIVKFTGFNANSFSERATPHQFSACYSIRDDRIQGRRWARALQLTELASGEDRRSDLQTGDRHGQAQRPRSGKPISARC